MKIGEEALAASIEGTGAIKKLKASTAGGGARAKVERGGTNTKQIEGTPVKVEVKKGEATLEKIVA